MFKKNENNNKCVDLLTEYFQLLVVDSAKEVFGFKKFNSRSVNWIVHDDISQLRLCKLTRS